MTSWNLNIWNSKLWFSWGRTELLEWGKKHSPNFISALLFRQIRRKLPPWLHLLKNSLMENFIFCPMHGQNESFTGAMTINSSPKKFRKTSEKICKVHRKTCQRVSPTWIWRLCPLYFCYFVINRERWEIWLSRKRKEISKWKKYIFPCFACALQ